MLHLHIAELDVLINLAIASDYYEGTTCRPSFSGTLCTNEAPYIYAKSLGHPVLRSDSLGKAAFVPNDITIGGPDQASFILLTGPNMGGKSTLLRQVCLAVILAQVVTLLFSLIIFFWPDGEGNYVEKRNLFLLRLVLSKFAFSHWCYSF
jgi:DNA mismatch repair ATPase MutS